MGQRLLIVDSDRRFIKDHQVALESAFDVDFVNTTDAVSSRLASGHYAGVLICVEVSENKGYALCSAIRKAPEFSHIKIGLISAKATEEEYSRHQTLKGRAADVYLKKPIDSSALVSELSALAPLRAVDPDNPLGDLSNNDMGEEWLDNLKSGIEEVEVQAPQPPAPPVPPVVPAMNLPIAAGLLPPPPKPQPVHQDAGKVELLESRVKDLEAKLSQVHDQVEDQSRQLQEKEEALQNKSRELSEALQDLSKLKTDAEQSASKDELQKAQETLQSLESSGTLRPFALPWKPAPVRPKKMPGSSKAAARLWSNPKRSFKANSSPIKPSTIPWKQPRRTRKAAPRSWSATANSSIVGWTNCFWPKTAPSAKPWPWLQKKMALKNRLPSSTPTLST